jgi:hypothetical protein
MYATACKYNVWLAKYGKPAHLSIRACSTMTEGATKLLCTLYTKEGAEPVAMVRSGYASGDSNHGAVTMLYTKGTNAMYY